jgi:hypothetical protein
MLLSSLITSVKAIAAFHKIKIRKTAAHPPLPYEMTPSALVGSTFNGVQAHQSMVVSRLKLCNDFEGCNALRLSRGVIAELRVLVCDATTVDAGKE